MGSATVFSLISLISEKPGKWSYCLFSYQNLMGKRKYGSVEGETTDPFKSMLVQHPGPVIGPYC